MSTLPMLAEITLRDGLGGVILLLVILSVIGACLGRWGSAPLVLLAVAVLLLIAR